MLRYKLYRVKEKGEKLYFKSQYWDYITTSCLCKQTDTEEQKYNIVEEKFFVKETEKASTWNSLKRLSNSVKVMNKFCTSNNYPNPIDNCMVEVEEITSIAEFPINEVSLVACIKNEDELILENIKEQGYEIRSKARTQGSQSSSS